MLSPWALGLLVMVGVLTGVVQLYARTQCFVGGVFCAKSSSGLPRGRPHPGEIV
jgi:hypothetical protein